MDEKSCSTCRFRARCGGLPCYGFSPETDEHNSVPVQGRCRDCAFFFSRPGEEPLCYLLSSIVDTRISVHPPSVGRTPRPVLRKGTVIVKPSEREIADRKTRYRSNQRIYQNHEFDMFPKRLDEKRDTFFRLEMALTVSPDFGCTAFMRKEEANS